MPRVLFDGAIYHVMFRGNAKQNIFLDGRDATRFVESLADKTADYSIRLYLYCMMPNHVHLLVETPLGNLSRFMGALLTGYSLYFNKRHDRVGHVMQGRFKSPVVSGDEYLLRLTRYIHLNPVRVEEWEERSVEDRIEFLHHFRWSSYRSYIGLREPEDFLSYGPIMKMVPHADGEDLQSAYRRYVQTGLSTTDQEIAEALRSSSIGIGGKEFRDQLQERIQQDDASLRQVRSRVSSEAVIESIGREFEVSPDRIRQHRRGNWPRATAALMLSKYADLTQVEVAVILNLNSSSAVSHMVRKLKSACAADPSLAQGVARISSELESIARTEAV